MRVLVIGGVSYDTLIHVGFLPSPKSQTIFAKKTVSSIGSTGAGKAIPLAKLGFDVTFHAMIGDDSYGKMIEERLKKENIKFIYDIDPKGTERHTNIMDDEGKRISIYTQSATFEPEINVNQLYEAIMKADIIVMNIINYARKFIDFIKNQHKPLWIDIHDYDGESNYHQDFINAADYLFMSNDLISDSDVFAKDMLAIGKQIVVVTDGRHGLTGYNPNEIIHIDAIKPKDIGDFNGAGDHALSGYLFGYTHHYSHKNCLKMAVLAATSCIESDDISNDNISSNWLIKEFEKAS